MATNRNKKQISVKSQIKHIFEHAIEKYVAEFGPVAYRHRYTMLLEEGTVILHGHGLLHAHAEYNGPLGEWAILLSDGHGKLAANTDRSIVKQHEVKTVCGQPWQA